MYTTTITNPTTNRQNKVKVWEIETKLALQIVKSDGVKGLSWHLLSEKEAIATMEQTAHGDSANNNFALNIFENALDWGLGLKVVAYLQAYANTYPGKQPKIVRVAANRKGDCFILSKDLQIVM